MEFVCICSFLDIKKSVNGDYGFWFFWIECSKLCGGGVRRCMCKCLNLVLFNGG